VQPGRRVGRYIVVVDEDGMRHAVAVSAALAATELETGGTLVLVTGGRLITIDAGFEEVLGWLSR
jgi:hypothetical protein